MRKLKTNIGAYKYKSHNLWINAIYKKNKTYIDSALSTLPQRDRLFAFKSLLYERLNDNIPLDLTKRQTQLKMSKFFNQTKTSELKKAIYTMSRTEVFVSRKQRLQENVYKAIKSDKELMRQFKQKTGRKKIDTEKFEWDYEDKVYKYEDVRIDISNSPYGIRIY